MLESLLRKFYADGRINASILGCYNPWMPPPVLSVVGQSENIYAAPRIATEKRVPPPESTA